MPRLKSESALSCPSCRLPVEEHLDFCHNCGETIHSYPRGRTPDKSLLAKRSPVPSLVVGAAVLLSLAVALIMGVTIYDFVHQYGVPGGDDVCQRSSVYIAAGQEDRAINLLEESLKIKGSDKRAAEWQALLDQALYNRGKKLAQEGKFRDAVTAFSRISAAFAAHDEVEKLIVEYTDKGIPAVFGKGEEDVLEKEKKGLSRLEKAVMTAVPGGKGRIEPMHAIPITPVTSPK
ncbi:MAG: hypothetical protein JSS83_07340 [Cyanobacteria bacterium SZAS LIN-3]|nr:hypothetical protein [Cyanobacteria bacterium SZAS LIN-3]MBS2010992.1 hypothetical protein [Cyanobacteria bacterium SZAS TMP-1]